MESESKRLAVEVIGPHAVRTPIVTLYTREMFDVAAVTMPNQREYAERWGVPHFVFPYNLTSRPPSWSKLVALTKVLDSFPAAMWVDADAVFTNMHIQHQNFLDQNDGDLIACGDHNGMCAGVFFARRRMPLLRFFSEVWDRTEYLNHPWWEQMAMHVQMRAEKVMPEGKGATITVLENSRAFNAGELGPQAWQPGDFIAHAAGMRGSKRVDWLKDRLKQVIR